MDALLDMGMRQECEATIHKGKKFTRSFISVSLWWHRVALVWLVHWAMGHLKKCEPNGARAIIRINYKKKKSHVGKLHYGNSYLCVGVYQLPQESHIREEVPLRSYRGNRTCGLCNQRSVSG